MKQDIIKNYQKILKYYEAFADLTFDGFGCHTSETEDDDLADIMDHIKFLKKQNKKLLARKKKKKSLTK